MTHRWFEGATRPRVLAHRGLITAEDAAHGVAENSFAAVAAAHAAGAQYIESDCHLTADGTVVLFHDDDLSRVTGDPRRVADVTATELEALMAARGGLITLTQALDAFPSVRFNLDVKAKDAAGEVGRIVAPHAHRVLLTSFSDERRRAALAAAENVGRGIRPATSAGSTTIGRVLAALSVRSSRLVGRALDGHRCAAGSRASGPPADRHTPSDRRCASPRRRGPRMDRERSGRHAQTRRDGRGRPRDRSRRPGPEHRL